MENQTNDQLAQTLHDAINEAESRALAAGKTRIHRLLQIAHRALHAAGVECTEDEDTGVSTQSTGGPKP